MGYIAELGTMPDSAIFVFSQLISSIYNIYDTLLLTRIYLYAKIQDLLLKFIENNVII